MSDILIFYQNPDNLMLFLLNAIVLRLPTGNEISLSCARVVLIKDASMMRITR